MGDARPLSQALLEQQLLLQEHPHVDYMLRTPLSPETEGVDKGIVMHANGARMLFKIAFDPEDYRKQLTAEHGVDPLSVPPGADFVTEEAFHAATMDPRFAHVEMEDLFAGFAGGAAHEEL